MFALGFAWPERYLDWYEALSLSSLYHKRSKLQPTFMLLLHA